MKTHTGYSTKHMQDIANRYMASGEPWPATKQQMAEWVIRNSLWVPHPASLVDQCAEMLARAMREEYFIDPQGRSVRAKHAARVAKDGEQTSLWVDLRKDSREFLEIAFQQRRQGVLADCRQLKVDVDSYNENINTGQSIQMVFDFTNDLLELEAIAS